MSKLPSAETQLRSAKTRIRELEGRLSASKDEIRTLNATAEFSSGIISKQNAEIAEWKRRFDLLLERTPKAAK